MKIRKFFDTQVDLRACRETNKSIHPAKRLDEAGYTGDARGALAKGGFQQAPCWLYSEACDADALYVFALKDGTRITADNRLLNGSPAYQRVVADVERIENKIERLENELMALNWQTMELAGNALDLSENDEKAPAEATGHAQQHLQDDDERLAKALQLGFLQAEEAELEAELKAKRANRASESSSDTEPLEWLKNDIERLESELMVSAEQMMEHAGDGPGLPAIDEKAPASAARYRQQHLHNEDARFKKNMLLGTLLWEQGRLKEKEAGLVAEVRTLVTRLHEKETSGGWTLGQRRLFNAAVDQLWMPLDIAPATGECPTRLTTGTAEEVKEKKALAAQYRKLYSIPDNPLLPHTQDVTNESEKLNAKILGLRTDPTPRAVIAEMLSGDKTPHRRHVCG